MDAEAPRWWSKAILIGALIALALLMLGAIGSRVGIWPFSTGFLMLAGGAVLAVIGVVVGIAGVVIAARRGLAADRPMLYVGTLISAVVVGYLGMQFNAARSVPPIHNISTDVADPPAFDAIVALRGEGSNPLAYDADAVAAQQQQAYPWVKTLHTDQAPQASFEKAVAVLGDMGIEIVDADPESGTVEGTATTTWFGFKDDVVVRIRPDGTGSKVDLRSVSRVGQSDLGVNAHRIGEFLTRFQD